MLVWMFSLSNQKAVGVGLYLDILVTLGKYQLEKIFEGTGFGGLGCGTAKFSATQA
jgi:hypothetical protein